MNVDTPCDFDQNVRHGRMGSTGERWFFVVVILRLVGEGVSCIAT